MTMDRHCTVLYLPVFRAYVYSAMLCKLETPTTHLLMLGCLKGVVVGVGLISDGGVGKHVNCTGW